MKRKKDISQEGMTTISYVLASALSLVIISWAVVFVVFSYTRASIRGASERASRAGIVEYSLSKDPILAIKACTEAYTSDIDQAIKGEIRNDLYFHCEIQGNDIHVISTTSVRSLSALFPNLIVNENTFRTFEKVPST
ncbi:MAG: hypothetical protein KBF89_01250 [Acidimicrobiia bacterium]|nr:hypothetical protein [Acidimicrobiia bacterium]